MFPDEEKFYYPYDNPHGMPYDDDDGYCFYEDENGEVGVLSKKDAEAINKSSNTAGTGNQRVISSMNDALNKLARITAQYGDIDTTPKVNHHGIEYVISSETENLGTRTLKYCQAPPTIENVFYDDVMYKVEIGSIFEVLFSAPSEKTKSVYLAITFAAGQVQNISINGDYTSILEPSFGPIDEMVILRDPEVYAFRNIVTGEIDMIWNGMEPDSAVIYSRL